MTARPKAALAARVKVLGELAHDITKLCQQRCILSQVEYLVTVTGLRGEPQGAAHGGARRKCWRWAGA